MDPTVPMCRSFLNFYEFHFDKYNGYEVTPTVRALFRDIVLDSCIDHAQKESQFQHFNQVILLNSEGPKDAADQFSARYLIDLLRILPCHLRLVYNLAVIDKLDNQDISSKMNISLSDIEAYLIRAKMELKAMLARQTVTQPG